MKRSILFFAFVIGICSLFVETYAQTFPRTGGNVNNSSGKTSDARVEKALKKSQLSYELDKDGSFKTTVKTPNNRLQNAFIGSEVNELLGENVRLIFSYAMIGDNPPSQEIANQMLEQNMGLPNNWAILRLDNNKFGIVNFIFVRADTDSLNLLTALMLVTEAADKMEEKLTGKDVL